MKEQQEEKLFVRCPEAKNCGVSKCEHRERHLISECKENSSKSLDNWVKFDLCFACIPVKPEGEQGWVDRCKTCKYDGFENEYCHSCDGLTDNYVPKESFKQPEQEKCAGGKSRRKLMRLGRSFKGTGLKPSEKVEGVSIEINHFLHNIVGYDYYYFNCKQKEAFKELRQSIEREEREKIIGIAQRISEVDKNGMRLLDFNLLRSETAKQKLKDIEKNK